MSHTEPFSIIFENVRKYGKRFCQKTTKLGKMGDFLSPTNCWLENIFGPKRPIFKGGATFFFEPPFSFQGNIFGQLSPQGRFHADKICSKMMFSHTFHRRSEGVYIVLDIFLQKPCFQLGHIEGDFGANSKRRWFVTCEIPPLARMATKNKRALGDI